MKYASIRLLGILGGLTGILMGAGGLLSEMIFWGHLPGRWVGLGLISPEIRSLLFILLGAIGLIAALFYSEGRTRTAQAILTSGLLGFPIGFASGSYLIGSWIYWIIPGIMLTTAGYIALATPGRIASSLPLVKSDKREIRFIGYALYSGLFATGIILLMAVFILAGIPGGDNSPSGNATRDQRDFENAEFAQGMGRLNDSLKSYDNIIARNQSNVRAWYLKGYTLSRLEMYDEALAYYDRVLEIDPGYYQAVYPRNELLRKINRSNKIGD
jgi:tetratricopeptide (TPR) repeat protein